MMVVHVVHTPVQRDLYRQGKQWQAGVLPGVRSVVGVQASACCRAACMRAGQGAMDR